MIATSKSTCNTCTIGYIVFVAICLQSCGCLTSNNDGDSSHVDLTGGDAARTTSLDAKARHSAFVPPVESIEEVIAEAYGHPLAAKDVGPFKVPKTKWESILRHFRQSEPHDSAWPKDCELGTVRLVLKGGRVIRLCWFWLGKQARLSFSCGGIRYRSVGERFASDETLTLDALVREIHDAL